MELAFREVQLAELCGYFDRDGHLSPFVHCVGDSSTGKTTIVKNALIKTKRPYAMVNCDETLCSARNIFENILECLSDDVMAMVTDNICAFVEMLRVVCDRKGDVVIVFDRIERLCDAAPSLLALLFRLPQLVGRVITIITTSILPWTEFISIWGPIVKPHIIQFPKYSKSELIEILQKCDLATSSNHAHFSQFVQYLVDTVHISTNDLNELLYLVQVNWPQVVDKLNDKGMEKGEVSAGVWKQLRPILQKSLDRLFFRCQDQETQAQVDQLQLPIFSKYLLLAAYMASYNPASTDRRYFLKKQVKQRGRWSRAGPSLTDSAHQLGPKSFPYHRLLYIFLQIVDNKDFASKLNLASQVMALVEMGLLVQTSADGNVDIPKFRCAASLQTVQQVARSLDFDLMCRLHDFASQ